MSKSKLTRLRAAHSKVAQFVVTDLAYLPIFQRLEAELAAEEARASSDSVAYARAALVLRSLNATNK